MFYIFIFLLLFIGVIFEYIRKDEKYTQSNVVFFILSGVLTIVSAIRYGSGSDYFGYMRHYVNNPTTISEALAMKTHMNPGYKIIMTLVKSKGLNFEGFIFFLSLTLMLVMTYLIWKNSKFKTMSLLIFYSVYYHIYINSALRQGITLVIFLWAYYTFLKENKIIKYSIAILIGSLFHYSILIMLIVPIVKFIYDRYGTNNKVNIAFIIIAFLAFIFKAERLLPIVSGMIGISIPYTSSSPRIMAILLRLVLLGMILLLYKFADKEKISEFDKFQIYTYFIGVILFIAVSNTPNLSRLTEFFSILDIFILANLISAINVKSVKLGSILAVIMIIGVIFIKDQASFIDQGSYYDKSITNYPYVTIFNKFDIFSKRQVEDKYIPEEFWVRLKGK